jgi:hypothetical protein
MDDDDIDTSGIPDFAPNPKWAKGPPTVSKAINAFDDIYIPEITKDTVISQLYIEAVDRTSRNQAARVRAWELIAELKGWKDNEEDDLIEEDNLTHEEIASIAKEFNTTY